MDALGLIENAHTTTTAQTPNNANKHLVEELEDHAHIIRLVPAIYKWHHQLVG